MVPISRFDVLTTLCISRPKKSWFVYPASSVALMRPAKSTAQRRFSVKNFQVSPARTWPKGSCRSPNPLSIESSGLASMSESVARAGDERPSTRQRSTASTPGMRDGFRVGWNTKAARRWVRMGDSREGNGWDFPGAIRLQAMKTTQRSLPHYSFVMEFTKVEPRGRAVLAALNEPRDAVLNGERSGSKSAERQC